MMVKRDLAQRYRGTAIGVVWSVIQPLFMMALYTFVFAVILKVKFGANGSTTSFALYLVCGLLPWLAFSEGLTRCASVVIDNANLVRKVVFPLEILPINVVAAALVSQIIGTAILLGACLAMGIGASWTWLAIPVMLIPQILWTLGLGWLLASIGVYVRDVGQIIGMGLTTWVFLTPIYYPATAIPARFRFLLDANPMATIVEGYRSLILDGTLPPLAMLGATSLAGLLVCILGHAWFFKTKRGFADVL